MKKSKNDVWVGLFVVLGAAALLFLALKSANLLHLNFQSTYQVQAKFDNIGGLKPKAAVKSAGVVVGRVESITFDDKSFQALVTFALEDRFQFPKDDFLGSKRNFKIQLVELSWRAIGPGVFITKARSNLEITIKSAGHQQLFKLLRSLGEGVELARV